MQVQNNHSQNFTGLGIIGKVKSKDIAALNSFISNQEALSKIKSLEDLYDTDVFLNTKASVISLKHKKHGYLNKYGMPKCNVSDFMNNFDGVLVKLGAALHNANLKCSAHQQWLDSIISHSGF